MFYVLSRFLVDSNRTRRNASALCRRLGTESAEDIFLREFVGSRSFTFFRRDLSLSFLESEISTHSEEYHFYYSAEIPNIQRGESGETSRGSLLDLYVLMLAPPDFLQTSYYGARQRKSAEALEALTQTFVFTHKPHPEKLWWSSGLQFMSESILYQPDEFALI
ncbi:unnamed protein product [Pleuronectes platessa]|uniref:Uncharacterized protein n=1 Tax=Pleuronectes platessa TaxID=8262 RepID=A0A9N7Y4D7_PLEPL|nr:unnamed protein product [Pleuronectes platessa]